MVPPSAEPLREAQGQGRARLRRAAASRAPSTRSAACAPSTSCSTAASSTSTSTWASAAAPSWPPSSRPASRPARCTTRPPSARGTPLGVSAAPLYRLGTARVPEALVPGPRRPLPGPGHEPHRRGPQPLRPRLVRSSSSCPRASWTPRASRSTSTRVFLARLGRRPLRRPARGSSSSWRWTSTAARRWPSATTAGATCRSRRRSRPRPPCPGSTAPCASAAGTTSTAGSRRRPTSTSPSRAGPTSSSASTRSCPYLNDTAGGPLRGHLSNRGVTWVLDQVLRIMLHGRMEYGLERYRREHPEVDILLIEPTRRRPAHVRLQHHALQRAAGRGRARVPHGPRLLPRATQARYRRLFAKHGHRDGATPSADARTCRPGTRTGPIAAPRLARPSLALGARLELADLRESRPSQPNQTERRRASRPSIIRWIVERTSSEIRLTRIGSSASSGP